MKFRHCTLLWVLAAVGAHGAELAHYRFDNGFADASGNGRDGVLTDLATLGNSVIGTTDKVFGTGAIDFSDDRDFIAIPELNFPAGATFTIALWAKRDSASRTYDVMAGNRDDEDNFLTFFNGNVVRYEGNLPADDSDRRDFSFSMGTDWHHYAFVSDGSAITVYADGNVIGSSATNTAFVLNTIGVGYLATLESDFQGKIDEFRVFDQALDASAINNLMRVNAVTRNFGTPRNFGRVVTFGDSITQAAFGSTSGTQGYRYALWKQWVQGGHQFDLTGSHAYNFNAADTSSITSISTYPNYLGQVFETTNEGHWGWRSTDILGTTIPTRTPGTGSGTLADWLTMYDADTVFLLLGVNDIRISTGATVAATAANLKTILNGLIADQPSVRIFLGSVLPTDASFADAAKINSLNVEYRKIAGTYPAVTYVDLHSGFNPAIHAYDGVHPNVLGEQVVANAFYEAAVPPGPAAGLVSYHRFEADFSNSSAASGPGASPVNTPQVAVNGGIAGKGLALSGADNDHVLVPVSFGPASALGSTFTVSAWYRLNDPIFSPAASGRYFVFEGADSFDVSYGLRNLSNVGEYGLNDGQLFTDATAVPNSANLTDAALPGWHHVAQTYLASGGITTITTYLDGVKVGTLEPTTASVSGSGFRFGAPRAGVNDRGFDGMLDEVALWNRALMPEEIAVVRNAGLTGNPIVTGEAPPLAPQVSFTATPAKIGAGESATLSWNVSGATTVTIEPGIGTVGASGSIDVSPGQSTLYTITAINGAVPTRAQAPVLRTLGPIRVYLLGGQSNMQGVGQKSKLVPLGLETIPQVLLYHSTGTVSTGAANTLITVRANGFDANSFGPEIGFADVMRDLRRDAPCCLIKHAVGGTSLQVKWKPGSNNSDVANFGPDYATFVTTVKAALVALESLGYEPEIHGMLWQQGEQDSKEGLNTAGDGNATSADDYGANLKHFVGRVREQFAPSLAPQGLRFVLGQVLPYAPAGGSVAMLNPGRDKVRQAQLDADDQSGAPLSITNTGIVPTDSTNYPVHEQEADGFRDDDEVHFNADAQLRLGRNMAYKMLGLSPQSYLDWSDDHELVGGRDDDDDHDGISNFLEFAGGGNPTDPASANRPVSGMLEVAGTSFLVGTFSRNLEALDAGWQVEFSDDLGQWNILGLPVLVSAEYLPSGVARLTYRAPVPAGVRGFLRMTAKD